MFKNTNRNLLKVTFNRVVGSGGAGGATAPPIFLDMRKKVAFSTPNISKVQEKRAQNFISTPNILQLPAGLDII